MEDSRGISALGKCFCAFSHALRAALIYLVLGSELTNRCALNPVLIHVGTLQRKASYVTIPYHISDDEKKKLLRMTVALLITSLVRAKQLGLQSAYF